MSENSNRVPRRSVRRGRLNAGARTHQQRLLWWSGLLAIPLLWQALGQFVSGSTVYVSPYEVLSAFLNLIRDGSLATALLESGAVLGAGLAVGCTLGLAVGLVAGRYRMVGMLIDPYLSALFAMPMVALVPILIVALGFGYSAKVVIVALFAFLPTVINTMIGVREVPRDFYELAHIYGSSERRLWLDILIPCSGPFIIAGLRLAVGRSLIAVVVAEFLTSVSGLGYLILTTSRRFEIAASLAPIIVLMLSGFLLYQVLKMAERRSSPWLAKAK